VTRFCAHGCETSASIKGRGIIEQVSDCQLFKDCPLFYYIACVSGTANISDSGSVNTLYEYPGDAFPFPGSNFHFLSVKLGLHYQRTERSCKPRDLQSRTECGCQTTRWFVWPMTVFFLRQGTSVQTRTH
jgi:hypothetical protein